MGIPFGFNNPASISDARFNMYQIIDRRLALANQVGPNTSQEELLSIFKEDKQLQLDKIKREVEEEYYFQWFEQFQALRKRKRDQRQRMFEMRAIFF